MDYDSFFYTLTENTHHEFQAKLAAKIIAGRSLILRAPTGAGKTWAAVAPFLYSLYRGQPLADRLIYALPLRSLASSLHGSVIARMKSAESLFPEVCSVGKNRKYGVAARYCSLQMGGESDDPFFEADVIFTTIDQLLSGYLGLPVSLPNRLGNMVAGALIGSFIVIDEVHLLEPNRAMGTVIEMLDRLQGFCQFMLMTATLSDQGADWLASKLNAESFVIPETQIRKLPSQRTKQRQWQRLGRILTAEEVRATHSGGRTIALTNTVGRAQDLFGRLQTLFQGSPTKLILLHARYFQEDRKRIEDQLADYFGPDAKFTDVVLVTTQVIEAGIDISADDLLTELAPMNALIQRAGRVARYVQRNTGRVKVYEIENGRPYDDERSIQATRDVLQEQLAQLRVIDFAEEQRWLDTVHGNAEIQALKTYDNLYGRGQQVRDAMEGDAAKLASLVRDIDSVTVILTDRPEDLNFGGTAPGGRRIGWPKMLSVPRSSLMRLAKFFGKAPKGSWVAKGARDTDEEGIGWKFRWDNIESAGELRSHWMVAVHPDFGSYSPVIGLVLGVGGAPPAIEYSELPRVPRYQYEFEPWVDHARRVCDQGCAMRESHSCGARYLAKKVASCNGDPAHTEQLVELACLAHDTGKLAAKWQRVAWMWQRDKDQRSRAQGERVPERPPVPLAHTSFDPALDKDYRGLSKYQFPNHAVEGAFAIEESLCERLVANFGEGTGLYGALAAISAIARHHSPHARNTGQFDLNDKAVSLIRGLLHLEPRQCDRRAAADEFADTLLNLLNPKHDPAWALYAFLVRRLRLADQASLAASA